MNDTDKLDAITDAFTKALVAHPFRDICFYTELSKRLAAILDAEIKISTDEEFRKFLMTAWGASVN